MTGTSAVLMPTNALPGNSSKLLAGRMGVDALAADDGGGDLAGFAALFARLAGDEGGDNAASLAALAESELPVSVLGDEVPVSSNTAAPVAPKQPMPLASGASAAALALMRLNEATLPEPLPAPASVVGPPQASVGASNTTDGETPEFTAPAEIETTDNTSQPPQTPVLLWLMPAPQLPPAIPSGTSDGGEQPQTDQSVPELLAQLASAPDRRSSESIKSQASPPPAPSAEIGPPAGVTTQTINPTMIASASAQAAVAQPVPVAAVAGARDKTARATDNGQGDVAPSNPTETTALAPEQPASTPPAQPLATASRRLTVNAGAVSSQTGSQEHPALPAADTGDPSPQALTSNLVATTATAPTSVESEPPRDPAALTAVRIGAVHQETYFGPVAPQSPVEQVAAHVVGELDAAPENSAAPSLDQAQQASAHTVKVLHLQLNPPDLGPLTVRMTLKNEVLNLQVEAGKQETAKLIDNDRDALLGLLRSAGYAVDGLVVQTAARADASSMNSGSGAFPQSSGQAQSGGQASQGRGGGQAWQGDGRGGEAMGGNGKDGPDTGTSRNAGGAVYL